MMGEIFDRIELNKNLVVALVMEMHAKEQITEGSAASMLELDRLDYRFLSDEVDPLRLRAIEFVKRNPDIGYTVDQVVEKWEHVRVNGLSVKGAN